MEVIGLESQKKALAQEILNIDSIEVLKSVSRAYTRAMTRLSAKKGKDVVAGQTDEYILNGLKEAFIELGKIKRGEVKPRPAEELLRELQAMEEEE
ncbi:MAG: hypothetical protein LBL97_00960 [Prevotellaceae bacterium]|jgi:hypothetical protein|nr:hypothetical protein [Prevotellaceae bacterium]